MATRLARVSQLQPPKPFNLASLADSVLRSNPTVVDDHVLAELVFDQISVQDRDAALQQALLREIAAAHGRFRGRHRPAPVRVIQSLTRSKDGSRSGIITGDRIRDGWKQMADQKLSTASGRKRLGECTPEDWDFICAALRKLGGEIAQKIRQYEAIKDLCVRRGVRTFDELPAEDRMRVAGVTS